VTEPRKGQPGWEDPRLLLPAPELIRAAEQAIRHAISVVDDDAGFWHPVADYLNDASHIPELTGNRNRDWRAFNRAQSMANAVIEMLNRRRVSVRDVMAGLLPRDASGVYWADTDYTECRPHLTDPSWRPDNLQESGERTGVVLTGPIVCNACEDDARAAAESGDAEARYYYRHLERE
jgi:hypothetical protein